MRELEDLNDERVALREDDIAVIGLAGRLPGAKDLREFWRNSATASKRFVSLAMRNCCRLVRVPSLSSSQTA